MERAVVLLFDPGLAGLIEQVERQQFLAFEHRHQAPFDASPERFLLGILVITWPAT
jgi:hypothetical protein